MCAEACADGQQSRGPNARGTLGGVFENIDAQPEIVLIPLRWYSSHSAPCGRTWIRARVARHAQQFTVVNARDGVFAEYLRWISYPIPLPNKMDIHAGADGHGRESTGADDSSRPGADAGA